MSMNLRVIGCSPAWPNPGGAQSGYLVESGPHRLLLDCGVGVLAGLRELDGDTWPSVGAIVLSHWHHDHWGDLVPWIWGTLAGPGKLRTDHPELWLPPPGRARLAGFSVELAADDVMARSFEIREYEAGVPFWAAGFEVTAARVPHFTGHSYALRISDGERVLAYSADCRPSDELVELARAADLFLCEATAQSAELDVSPRAHMTADEAVAAFEAAGAKRLLLTHRPCELPVPPGRELAYDGLLTEV